jgi:hypothetical protein
MLLLMEATDRQDNIHSKGKDYKKRNKKQASETLLFFSSYAYVFNYRSFHTREDTK